jgi:hypothetical protein
VQFDQQLAADAVDALRSAVRLLQHTMSVDVPLGNQALLNWKGPHADRFRSTFQAWQKTNVPQLIDTYNRWITIIENAGHTAASMQAAHDRANHAWQQSQPTPVRRSSGPF